MAAIVVDGWLVRPNARLYVSTVLMACFSITHPTSSKSVEPRETIALSSHHTHLESVAIVNKKLSFYY